MNISLRLTTVSPGVLPALPGGDARPWPPTIINYTIPIHLRFALTLKALLSAPPMIAPPSTPYAEAE